MRRNGFTLAELITVIAVIGILVGITIPAVQMAREAARRSQCKNNLRNIGLGIDNFVSANRHIPFGSDLLSGTEHSWASKILPYVEQTRLYERIDFTKAWNDPTQNSAIANENIVIFRCPSAVQDFPGKIDFGGIQGTALTDLPIGMSADQAFGCGSIIVRVREQPSPLHLGSITDGLSNTLSVAESSDRNPESSGRWACGRNCFSQNHQLGDSRSDGMSSLHSNGVHGLFMDGRIQFMSKSTSARVLGSWCTRSGAEVQIDEVD